MMIAIKVLLHSTWPQNSRFLLASPRMDRFSRIDIRRPFALYCLPWDRESCARKSALQLALHHMSYKAFCTWCHARNIRKPTTFIDVYRYISVQSTACLWNGPLQWSLRGMSHIPPVWGKWHGPAIWSKRSHRPIYPSSEVWLRWKSRTTVSPVRSKSLMNLPWVTGSLPNSSESWDCWRSLPDMAQSARSHPACPIQTTLCNAMLKEVIHSV